MIQGTGETSDESLQDIVGIEKERMQQMAGSMTLSIYQKISCVIQESLFNHRNQRYE